MVRDVDEQILLLERLDDGRQDDRDDLERGGRDGGLGDEDTGVELVLGDVLREGAHLLDADAGIGGEFDPDGADLGEGRGVGFGGQGGVFGQHGVGGAEGGVHLFAAARWVSSSASSTGWVLGGRTRAHRWGQHSSCETHRERS